MLNFLFGFAVCCFVPTAWRTAVINGLKAAWAWIKSKVTKSA